MIAIELLGGAKKAIGKSMVILEQQISSLSEILVYLQNNAVKPSILDPKNILIAINGVDSSVLNGYKTKVKTGDVVTVVTIVHGGSR